MESCAQTRGKITKPIMIQQENNNLPKTNLVHTKNDHKTSHMSLPTVTMWCAHTTYPNRPIASIAKIIPRFPNAFYLSRRENVWKILNRIGGIMIRVGRSFIFFPFSLLSLF
jgi:hypothetical protein